MTSKEWIEMPVLTIQQPIGSFYVGVSPFSDIVPICKANPRRPRILERDSSDADLPSYMGIQRFLSLERVREIQDYIRTIDACFPNTIILSVPSEATQLEGSKLKIRNEPGVATIIDGQHRLAGFSLDRDNSPFELIVTIFLDLEQQEQAYLFSTINTKQTRINPSLAQDLEDFSSTETPEKIAHNIAKISSSDPQGPWYQQIKMLGSKDQISQGIITQHAFSSEIVALTYPTKQLYNSVRSKLKEHKNQRSVLKIFHVDPIRYPLWQFYLDEQDAAIRKILDNYFSTVKKYFPEWWNNPSSILNKAIGYQALMKELRKLIPEGTKLNRLTGEFFSGYVAQARERVGDRPITIDEFGSGGAGAESLRKALFGE